MKKKMSFNELVSGSTPTLIDFSAEWCGPCRSMAPVLKELVSKVGKKARVVKIDIDRNPAVASAHNIMGVPTFVLYKNGRVIWRKSGMHTLAQLEQVIEQTS